MIQFGQIHQFSYVNPNTPYVLSDIMNLKGSMMGLVSSSDGSVELKPQDKNGQGNVTGFNVVVTDNTDLDEQVKQIWESQKSKSFVGSYIDYGEN